MKELNWEAENADEPFVVATVKSSTVRDDQLTIIFQGSDDWTRVQYEGRIALKLHTDEQEYHGTYSTAGRTVPFDIKGRFADTAFCMFEGRWYEPGWSADVCIL